MGIGGSVFKREELDIYEACTCLSGGEILELYAKFTSLGGVRAPDAQEEQTLRGSGRDMRMSAGDVEAQTSTSAPKPVPVKMANVIELPELRNNPFKVRLCQIFSSFDKDSAEYGDLYFDEFVDLYNVMSPRASKEVKMQTAFRLYDYGDDGFLTPDEDIAELVKALSTTKSKVALLNEKEMKDIVDRVMRDCDIDGNNRLSYAEFAKVIGRIPDFHMKFRMHIQ